MIESPLIQELMAQKGHKYVLASLRARFETVPPELKVALQTIVDEDKLEELAGWAAICPDLAAFQARLRS